VLVVGDASPASATPLQRLAGSAAGL